MMKTRIGRGFLAGALAMGLSAAAFPAFAQQNDGFGGEVMHWLRIQPKEEPDINYRERSPLVLPPKLDLPKPQAPSAASARNQAWPNDPDVARRQREIAEGRRPAPTGVLSEGGQRLSNDEIRRGRVRGAGLNQGPAPTRGDDARDLLLVSPDALRGTARPEPDQLTAGVEPDRRALTDPPKGYLRPTETVRAKQEPVQDIDNADPRRFQREERRAYQ